MSAILETARAAYAAGLVPVPTENTGSKKPDLPPPGRWKHYQTTRPSVAEMRAFDFAAHDGLGIIAGAGSGCRECWDFDTDDVFVAFVDRARATGLGELVDRLTQGYLDKTPGGGRRIIVEYPATLTFKDVTLARRPGRAGEPEIKVLIELPTFAIIAPSNGRTHPSGKAYERLVGDFTTIASYTVEERAALFSLAKSFDEMPRIEARTPSLTHTDVGTRPGDDYNRRTTWPQLLEPRGWTIVFDRDGVTYWRRPGKTSGVSATTNYAGSDLLYVFSSSTLFNADKSYSKFAALAVLEHAGDFARAALALSKQGYGDDRSAAGARAPSVTTGQATIRPVLIHLSDVQPEKITWLWPGRLALGKLALLAGDPGLGKSWTTLDLAARLSAGEVWPDRAPAVPQADVVLLSAEDGLADTIRPRLDQLGADVRRIHHVPAVWVGESQRSIRLSDIEALAQALEMTRAQLLVIDPLSAYLGDTDSHRDSEVRGLLAPLADLADRMQVAILGVMHLSKGTQRPALYRAIGSIAFTAAARLVHAVAVDPDDESRRIFMSVKSNLGAPPAALAYRLTDSGLVWDAEPVPTVDVDRLLSGPPLDRQERRETDEWLREMLADGPLSSKEIEREAEQAGIARRTLFRSKQRVGVDAARMGGLAEAGKWYWSLPTQEASAKSATKSATPDEVALLAQPPVITAHFTGLPAKSATPDEVALLVAPLASDADQVVAVLTPEPRMLWELAEMLDEPVEAIDQVLRRHPDRFVRLTDTPDGIHRWACQTAGLRFTALGTPIPEDDHEA